MPDNKKYVSIYGATRSIRGDQYLVELIIQRRSAKQGVKLPERFWSKKLYSDGEYDYWAKFFYSECSHAKKLFDKYDSDCIIEAFNSYDCRNILSCVNKQLEKTTKEYQRRKNVLESVKESVKIKIVSPDIVPKKSKGKLTKLGKLK